METTIKIIPILPFTFVICRDWPELTMPCRIYAECTFLADHKRSITAQTHMNTVGNDDHLLIIIKLETL